MIKYLARRFGDGYHPPPTVLIKQFACAQNDYHIYLIGKPHTQNTPTHTKHTHTHTRTHTTQVHLPTHIHINAHKQTHTYIALFLITGETIYISSVGGFVPGYARVGWIVWFWFCLFIHTQLTSDVFENRRGNGVRPQVQGIVLWGHWCV